MHMGEKMTTERITYLRLYQYFHTQTLIFVNSGHYFFTAIRKCKRLHDFVLPCEAAEKFILRCKKKRKSTPCLILRVFRFFPPTPGKLINFQTFIGMPFLFFFLLKTEYKIQIQTTFVSNKNFKFQKKKISLELIQTFDIIINILIEIQRVFIFNLKKHIFLYVICLKIVFHNLTPLAYIKKCTK